MSPVAQPIPLLLVADSAEMCERIASALLSAPAFYRIERMTSPDLNQKGPPSDIRLALVDQDLRSAKPAQVVQRLNSANIASVALVDARDGQTLQEVVLAGAAALVATPFVDAQLWETVGRVLAAGARLGPAGGPPAAKAPRGRDSLVVAVYTPKSGSGGSVLAANLAVTLQQRAARGAVLMEVGEGTGSQAILLNLHSERTLGDLLARFDPNDAELLRDVLIEHSSGLRVLVSPPSQSVRIPPDMLEEIIDILRRMFDFIVLDLHASAISSTIAMMRKAHAVLLIVTPEMTSLHHGRQFVEMVEATLPEVGLNILLNRANLAGGVPADAIRRHLRMQIAEEIPDDQPLVTASVNRGVPFVLSHPRSPLARAVQKVALNLAPDRLAGADRSSAAGEAAGPLGRLFGWGKRE